MKVVLRQDIESLGELDNLVSVSDGYARNYLLPRKLAVAATPPELAAVEKRKGKSEALRAAKRAEHEAVAAKLNSLEISISADAGEEGKLFGSVTAQDIAAAIKDSAGIELDKKKIELAEPLKIVGEYSVPVKIYKDIASTVKIKVVAKA